MAFKWLGEQDESLRYRDELDTKFKWIKFTTPCKDPRYAVAEISTAGLEESLENIPPLNDLLPGSWGIRAA